MKASEGIELIKALIEEHGDLELVYENTRIITSIEEYDGSINMT